jgi:hypothetical protein
MLVFNKLNRYIISNKSNLKRRFAVQYYNYEIHKKYIKYINQLAYGHIFKYNEDFSIEYSIVSQSNAYLINLELVYVDNDCEKDHNCSHGRFYTVSIFINNKLKMNMEPTLRDDAQYYIEYLKTNKLIIEKYDVNDILDIEKYNSTSLLEKICIRCFKAAKKKYYL